MPNSVIGNNSVNAADGVAVEDLSASPAVSNGEAASVKTESPPRTGRFAAWREDGVRVPVIALAVAGAVVVLGSGFFGYRYFDVSNRNDDLTGTVAQLRAGSDDRQAALEAGRAFINAANNIDYMNLDPFVKAMTDGSTGAFHDSYAPSAGSVSEVIKVSQLRIKGNVTEAGIATQTDNSIRVIAFVEQTIQSLKLPQPTPVNVAMYVDLMKVSDHWLVYGMSQGSDGTLRDPATAQGQPGDPSVAPPAADQPTG